jgi:hypothetical protein
MTPTTEQQRADINELIQCAMAHTGGNTFSARTIKLIESAPDLTAQDFYIVKTWNAEYGDMDSAEVYRSVDAALAFVANELSEPDNGLFIDPDDGITIEDGKLSYLCIVKASDHDHTLIRVERLDLLDGSDYTPLPAAVVRGALCAGPAALLKLLTAE